MNIDQATEIRRAVDTGEVLFGIRETEKSVLHGKGELIIISSNCPIRSAEKLRHFSGIFGIPMIDFPGSGLELGAVCGKPFVVSTLVVINPGKSKVIGLTQTAAKAKPKTTRKPRKAVQKKAAAKKALKKAKTKTHKSAVKTAVKSKGKPAKKTKKR